MANNIKEAKSDKKMLGAFVPEELYWKFKNMAAKRREEMQEAIVNAAYLYLDLEKEEQTNGSK